MVSEPTTVAVFYLLCAHLKTLKGARIVLSYVLLLPSSTTEEKQKMDVTEETSHTFLLKYKCNNANISM